MKAPVLILVICSLTSSVAAAHDVTGSDGSLWVHDHGAFVSKPVRNVSGTAPQVTSCDQATWPDIPAICISSPPIANAK